MNFFKKKKKANWAIHFSNSQVVLVSIKKKKNIPTNKNPEPDSITGEFYLTFREELTPIILKLFQSMAEGGTLPNFFYEATITLVPN